MISTMEYYDILKPKTKEMDINFLLDFLETEIDRHLSGGELSFNIQSDLLKKRELNSKRNTLFAIDIVIWTYSKLGWKIELRRIDFGRGIINMEFQFKTMKNYDNREEEDIKNILKKKDFQDIDLSEFKEHIIPQSYSNIVRKAEVL